MGPKTKDAGILRALSDELAQATEQAGRSVVAIHARRRIPSSGVVWRSGVIVTADHTLEKEEDIRVTIADGTAAGATLAGRDASTDLAVLRIEGGDVAAAQLADPAELQVGRLVLALGRPWEGAVTASLGVISALGGEWRTWQGGRIDRLVRLDMTVHDGFSGGPLVTSDGAVLGINTSGLTRGGAVTVPLTTVARVVDQLLERGHVRRGYLGVGMQPVRLPPDLREKLGLTAEIGLMVVHLDPGGAAERGGILLGDVVVAMDGTVVRDLGKVAAVLGPERVGQPLDVQVVRAGTLANVTVTVAERPREG